MFPLSIEENIGDIWRGNIMQNIIWKKNSCIIYYYSDTSINKETHNFLFEEKKNFYELNRLLQILNMEINHKDSIKFIDIIKELIENKLLTKEDLKSYMAFQKDLINIGYKVSKISKDITLKNNSINLRLNPEKTLYLFKIPKI